MFSLSILDLECGTFNPTRRLVLTSTIERLLTERNEQYGFSSWSADRLKLFKSLPDHLLTKILLDIEFNERDLHNLSPEQILALPLVEILPDDPDTKTKMIESYQTALKDIGTIEIAGMNEDGDFFYQPTAFTYEEDVKLIQILKEGNSERQAAIELKRSVEIVHERADWLQSCSLDTLEQLKAYHEKEQKTGGQ